MMGLYAMVDDLQLQRMLAMQEDELFDTVEELYDTVPVDDIDMFWDGLHYLLTGYPASEPPMGNPCSPAIMGEELFSEDEEADYIAYTRRQSLPMLLEAMEKAGKIGLEKNFSLSAMERAGVYPGIWREKDREDLWESLVEEYQNLIHFYQQAIAENKNIVVSIY